MFSEVDTENVNGSIYVLLLYILFKSSWVNIGLKCCFTNSVKLFDSDSLFQYCKIKILNSELETVVISPFLFNYITNWSLYNVLIESAFKIEGKFSKYSLIEWLDMS